MMVGMIVYSINHALQQLQCDCDGVRRRAIGGGRTKFFMRKRALGVFAGETSPGPIRCGFVKQCTQGAMHWSITVRHIM